ncbi:hypothetical protein GH714_022870 [Hevea brasiliensis]|uniref:Uncharacterized protein n=1 Tax=Hevea brasiliensis TaxID=3981 RepID=A0A6A6NIR0_HEVBR|nr:hypothetical protein GH714_022870 [Hevea brasiliensis]
MDNSAIPVTILQNRLERTSDYDVVLKLKQHSYPKGHLARICAVESGTKTHIYSISILSHTTAIITVTIVCDEDLDIGGVANFLEKLTAVATGSGGDGQVVEAGFSIETEIGDEELFGVNGLVERQARELEVGSKEDAAGGSKAHRTDVVVGYGRGPRTGPL